MNITDLAFKYEIDIDFNGDIEDGMVTGCYNVTIKHEIGMHSQHGDVKIDMTLGQSDINELYEGAKKLVKALEKHVTGNY